MRSVRKWKSRLGGSGARRAHNRNDLSPVPAIDAEILFIDCDHGQIVVQFAHANEAQVSKTGRALLIPLGQLSNRLEILGEVKCDLQEAVPNEAQNPLG